MGDISLILCYNTNNMSKKVCFIGHRRIGYGPIKERLENAIREELKSGCRLFTMGTHGEFDSLALSICRKLRNEYKDMEIEVVLTSLSIFNKPKDENEIYFEPYKDVKTVFYEIEEEYFKKQITTSNRQMVDTCDTLICYVNKKQYQSGAKTTMNYAKRQGLQIVNLYHEEDEPTFGMTEEQKKEYWDNINKELNKLTYKK